MVRAYRIARDVTGAERRWAEVEQLTGVDRQAQWKLLQGIDELVESTARWYLENADGADLGTAIATGREGFGRLLALLPARRAARGAVGRGGRARRAGRPRPDGHAHAYLTALGYAPDVISAAGAVGRSVEDAGMAFVLLEDRVQIAWIEEQLDALPVSTRMQRWALQALRDDLWRARRELACKALNDAPGASVEDAVERFVEAHPDGCSGSPISRARWRGRAAPTSPA